MAEAVVELRNVDDGFLTETVDVSYELSTLRLYGRKRYFPRARSIKLNGVELRNVLSAWAIKRIENDIVSQLKGEK